MKHDRNLSKGPFKGKGESLSRGILIARIKMLNQGLALVRKEMGDLMQEMNQARSILGRGRFGGFRARVHRIGGRFAVRIEWHDSSSSFQLVSEEGQRLLRGMDAISGELLIGFERRREMLNHRYRTIFAERRSLRQLHKFDEGIGKLIAELAQPANQPEQGNSHD